MKKIIIIISLLCIGIFIFILNNNNSKIKKEVDILSLEVKEGEKVEIAIDNKSIQKLYSKIEPDFLQKVYDEYDTYANNNYYMDKLITYNDLNEPSKLYYAYKQLKNIKRKYFNNCEELKNYSLNNKTLTELCNSNPLMIKKDYSSEEWQFNDVNKEKLEEAYKDLYGSEKKIPTQTFTTSYTGKCIYSEEEDNFLCYQTTGSNSSLNEVRTKINKVIKYHDYIEIYDNYVWIEIKYQVSNYKIDYYKSRLKKELISSETQPTYNINDEIINNGALYKHTFKKNKGNTYYWYSSERIE